jgi:stringent starvation protein B
VPMVAILAIYAKENGQGMVFGSEAGAPDPNKPPEPKREEKPVKSRPSLKVVK